MSTTNLIHALKIPFQVPLAPNVTLDRFVYVYLIFGRNIYLVDSGVAGSASRIYDYVQQQGRHPNEISGLILTHAHPDHIGGAKRILDTTPCPVYLHAAEITWAKNTELQFKERPVPGFHTLVEGSIKVGQILQDGDRLELEEGLTFSVIHTPGHSPGSVSLLHAEGATLLSGDALIPPHELPLYDDIKPTVESIRKLQSLSSLTTLFSSWEEPLQGAEIISQRMQLSLEHLILLHHLVCEIGTGEALEPLELCQRVFSRLGLPPAVANPLVARGLRSSLTRCHESL